MHKPHHNADKEKYYRHYNFKKVLIISELIPCLFDSMSKACHINYILKGKMAIKRNCLLLPKCPIKINFIIRA